jgi:uncharacterized protein (DUF3820 family)
MKQGITTTCRVFILNFETMNDLGELKIKFGKYKGTKLKDIPDNYLNWCILNNILKGKQLVYAKTKLKYLKDKFKVIVEDSAGTDGTYIVEAYYPRQAQDICRQQYKIRITQSFHGTSFDVTKL